MKSGDRKMLYVCAPVFDSMFRKHYLLYFILVCCVFSCIPNKRLVYLQKKDSKAPPPVDRQEEIPIQFKPYKVQVGDVLNIKVLSQDPLSVAAFNVDAMSGTAQTNLSVTQLYVSGYSVDEQGFIELPLLGKVLVRDKEIPEVIEILSKGIDKFASNAVVKVKLVSFKVTVLGEVKMPGVHYIYNDRANLLEVLGYAGDMNDLANRQKIKVYRTVDQKLQVTNIDLLDRKFIESNAFYILPNDVIYVEPTKAKNFRLNLPIISLTIATLTSVLVVINILGK